MSYFMSADLNFFCAEIITFITFTVVSVAGESRTTRAVERSIGICASRIVPAAVVGTCSAFIDVCNEIN